MSVINCLFLSPLYNIALSTIANELQWKLPLSHRGSILLSILLVRSVTLAIAFATRNGLYNRFYTTDYSYDSRLFI